MAITTTAQAAQATQARYAPLMLVVVLALFAALLGPLAAPAAATTVTPTAPPCKIKRIFGVEYGRDCSEREAYASIAMETLGNLRTAAGSMSLYRLATATLGPSAAKSPHGPVAAGLAQTKYVIRVAYAERDYERASCVRTSLLDAYVQGVAGRVKAADLSKALSITRRFIKGKVVPGATVYSAVLKVAPDLAVSMSNYLTRYNGALNAMSC